MAQKYDLLVKEDSADTIGGKIIEKSSGFYTDMSITGFYGSHIINCAGNNVGALALNDDSALEKAKLLRSWGKSSSLFDENSESIENRFNFNLDGIEYDTKFVFETVGYNLEGSEIGAVFGLEQLKNYLPTLRQDKLVSIFKRISSTASKTFLIHLLKTLNAKQLG